MSALRNNLSILGKASNWCPGHVFSVRSLFITPSLCAEPMRKKKRLDPALLRVRVERKILKTEREINRIMRAPKKKIPILEYQYTAERKETLQSNKRDISLETLEQRQRDLNSANKLWSVYRNFEAKIQAKSVKQMERAQDRALAELKKVCPKLYDGALKADNQYLIPYQNISIKKETPPNPDYVPPDGEMKDATKEWIL